MFGFIGEIYDAITSETKNPSLFQGWELDRHRAEIQQLCGEHGLVEAVKGRPHTFEANGIRFVIEDHGLRVIGGI